VSALSTAASVSQQYNLDDYVPPSVQNDVATGESIYDAAASVAANTTVGPHGSIALSDTARTAITSTIIGGISVVAPELGAAYAILLAIGPKAGPGPGVCSTNPPINSLPSTLVSWPYFKSWAGFFGPYPTYPAGTFESFANPILEYNWLLFSNCFSDSSAYVPPPILLGLLINAWNSKHASSSKRTIARSGLNANFGQQPASYDPISNALETALIAKYTGSAPANETFEQSIAAESAVPNNLTSSFVINDGPLIVQVVALHLRQPSGSSTTAATTAATSSSPSTAKRVAVGAAIVVGAGALGVGAWAFLTHQSYLGALKGIVGLTGINPLPLAAEASSKTTVQTLIFPRPRYSPSRAKAWARAHNYAVRKEPDIKEHTIRIRQRNPSEFEGGSFRTISLGKSGVKAVVGHLR